MASLMEELLDVLEKESTEYEALLEISKRKTPVIVSGKIEDLQDITDEEQVIVDRISHLDSKRETVTKDIANVINKDVESLKLSVLIGLLDKQPAEQKRLADVHDRLKTVVSDVRRINEQNRELIDHSLEMVQFDLNMIKAMNQAPETANYGPLATNSGEMLGTSKGSFDAKQ